MRISPKKGISGIDKIGGGGKTCAIQYCNKGYVFDKTGCRCVLEDVCKVQPCTSSIYPLCVVSANGTSRTCACQGNSCGAGKTCVGGECVNCPLGEDCGCSEGGGYASGAGVCECEAAKKYSNEQCINCTSGEVCGCPTGQAANGQGSCIAKPACPEDCATCDGNSSSCLSCKAGYEQYTTSTGQGSCRKTSSGGESCPRTPNGSKSAGSSCSSGSECISGWCIPGTTYNPSYTGSGSLCGGCAANGCIPSARNVVRTATVRQANPAGTTSIRCLPVKLVIQSAIICA